jgi:lysine-N-methylase
VQPVLASLSCFSRPRLSERALSRLHFVEGRCRVLLHDVETGDVVEVGPREWVLLSSADGTRDVEGILLAASREGVIASREALDALLDGVRSAGLLEDGPAPRRPRAEPKDRSSAEGEPGAPAGIAPGARPIERLEGYSFTCDGHGSCCRLYATVVFSPLEAARARSLLPDVLDGGERHEHVFMPERGAGPCAGSAVALVDGRCAYLDGHLCALHRAGGAGSKPLGCNLFPIALVDDGTRVRASVSVECACVLASVGKEGGAPILPETMRTRGDLDPAVVVDELPPEVEVRPGARAGLAEYLSWSDAALAALSGAPDAALAAWGLADALGEYGLSLDGVHRVFAKSSEIDLDLAGRYLGALAGKAARRARAQSAWRGERDLCRRGVSGIAASAALLADPDVLSAVVHGAGAPPRGAGVYRAVAMWIARVVPLAADALWPGEVEPAFTHPLALVEALMRGHGLRRYTEEAAEGARITA